MPTSWWFKEDALPLPIEWTWRMISDDGCIVTLSLPFAELGQTISDAMESGFQPGRDYWTIESSRGVTRFRPGQDSVYIHK